MGHRNIFSIAETTHVNLHKKRKMWFARQCFVASIIGLSQNSKQNNYISKTKMFEDFHHDEATMHSGSASRSGGEEQSNELLFGFHSNVKV